LFGYERGAFTGAQLSKAGLIELAARGVLFLDEVSEMSLTAQVKLLRFVQEREYQRLGGTRLQKADVRIIAASNRDLGDAVDRGTFREDFCTGCRSSTSCCPRSGTASATSRCSHTSSSPTVREPCIVGYPCCETMR